MAENTLTWTAGREKDEEREGKRRGRRGEGEKRGQGGEKESRKEERDEERGLIQVPAENAKNTLTWKGRRLLRAV